ncbi:MAG: hypothetical protein QM645_00225 [Asticcacaulis sp.]
MKPVLPNLVCLLAALMIGSALPLPVAFGQDIAAPPTEDWGRSRRDGDASRYTHPHGLFSLRASGDWDYGFLNPTSAEFSLIALNPPQGIKGQCYVELQPVRPVYENFKAAQNALRVRKPAFEDLFTQVIRRVYPERGQFIDFQALEIAPLNATTQSLQARALIVNPDAEFYLHGWGVELASGQSLLLSCFTPDKAPDWLDQARESLTLHVR